jgi:YD repeat-containing protein
MDSRCIATWGDGGIYKRKLVYGANNHTTIVTDSRDGDTIYQMNADNAVVSVTDALSTVTKYEFDDCYNKAAETDPLGRADRLPGGRDFGHALAGHRPAREEDSRPPADARREALHAQRPRVANRATPRLTGTDPRGVEIENRRDPEPSRVEI